MTAPNVDEIGQEIRAHQASRFSSDDILSLSQQFRREGIIVVPEIVPGSVREMVRQEAFRLLDDHAERHDLRLATTDDTPRKMSVVKSETIAENSTLINVLYKSKPLLDFLEVIASQPLLPCPSKDEEFLITRHEQPGDSHGWHWGDFSFALIWILECPPIEAGGLLQCVPHTNWDKSNPRVHQYLAANLVRTYTFRTGDIYFLRTDTTLHGTIPLNRPCVRVILNMTWASQKDVAMELVGNDRWWAEAEVPSAAQP